MLTFDQAKEKGISACINKLGSDFVKKYEKKSCVGFGDVEEYLFCFVGVDNQEKKKEEKESGGALILDDGPGSEWPYIAKCKVWYESGQIDFLECVLP